MSYVYRAMWPIEDVDRTRSALIAAACAGLDAMAATDGARLIGPPVWTVAGDRLLCEAPAVPVDDQEEEGPESERLARRDADVIRLAGLHWSDRQIAATTGVPRSTVRAIIARYETESNTA